MNQKRNWLALCGLLTSLQALAAPTATWTTNDSHTYANSNGFESTGTLADSTVLTNQFAAGGIVFSGTARANGCGTVPNVGWSVFGLAGQNYVNTFGSGCTTNTVVDSLSMKFSSDLQRFALDIYSATRGSESDLVQLFNDGSLVASFSLGGIDYVGLASGTTSSSSGRQFANYSERMGILVVNGNGANFDEVRFVETAAGASGGNFVFFDNVRFDAANTVPEPASLGLVAVALAACGLRRRKA